MVELSNELKTKLGYNLRRSSVLMMNDLSRELGEFGLKVTDATSLMVIGENEGCSQTEVGVALATKRANMVPIVQRLRERGLIDRVRTDGRAQALHLSEDGRVMVSQLKQMLLEHERRFTDRLSKREFQTLMQLLQKVRGI